MLARRSLIAKRTPLVKGVDPAVVPSGCSLSVGSSSVSSLCRLSLRGSTVASVSSSSTFSTMNASTKAAYLSAALSKRRFSSEDSSRKLEAVSSSESVTEAEESNPNEDNSNADDHFEPPRKKQAINTAGLKSLMSLSRPPTRVISSPMDMIEYCRDYWTRYLTLFWEGGRMAKKEDGSSASEGQLLSKTLVWSGLRHLWLAQELQGVEHFPSDVLWEHRLKNAYLLEVDKCIESADWREWMMKCQNTVVPVTDTMEREFGADSLTARLFYKRTMEAIPWKNRKRIYQRIHAPLHRLGGIAGLEYTSPRYMKLHKRNVRRLRSEYLNWYRNVNEFNSRNSRKLFAQRKFAKSRLNRTIGKDVAKSGSGGLEMMAASNSRSQFNGNAADLAVSGERTRLMFGKSRFIHQNPSGIRGGVTIPNLDMKAVSSAMSVSSSNGAGYGSNGVISPVNGSGLGHGIKYTARTGLGIGLVPEPKISKPYALLKKRRKNRTDPSMGQTRNVRDDLCRYILTRSLISKYEDTVGSVKSGDERFKMEADRIVKNDLKGIQKSRLIGQFMDRIRKSDLRWNAYQRWMYLKRFGNSSLAKRVYGFGGYSPSVFYSVDNEEDEFIQRRSKTYDGQFTDEMVNRLRKLSQINPNLCRLIVKSMRKDKILSKWTGGEICMKNIMDGGHPSIQRIQRRNFKMGQMCESARDSGIVSLDPEMLQWTPVWDEIGVTPHSKQAGQIVSMADYSARLDQIRAEEEKEEDKQAGSKTTKNKKQSDSLAKVDGHRKILNERLDSVIRSIIADSRAHSNLLNHSLEDVNKCVLLCSNGYSAELMSDPLLQSGKDSQSDKILCSSENVFAAEGYSGDLSTVKNGLWYANRLPIAVLRPHMVALKDLMLDSRNYKNGKYIEIRGSKGSGKSVTLMYALSIARSMPDTLTIYCPNTNLWVRTPGVTVPSNKHPGLFYQKEFAHRFFENMISDEQSTNVRILQSLDVQRSYPKPGMNYGKKGGSLNEEGSLNDQNKPVTKEMVKEMLRDPTDIRRFEDIIMAQWAKQGDSDSGFYNEGLSSDGSANRTLYDLCAFGSNREMCQNPSELMYDFMSEVRMLQSKQGVRTVMVMDDVNWWNHLVFGLTNPRYPRVFGWQLSMVDLFQQFQQAGTLPNGLCIMAHTSRGKLRPQMMKSDPDFVIDCPMAYTNRELDTVLELYQSIGLSSPQIAPDDWKKIEGASAKNPLFTQRLACLY